MRGDCDVYCSPSGTLNTCVTHSATPGGQMRSQALAKEFSTLASSEVFRFSSVQFSSVQDGIYELGKAHMRSAPSLRSFPSVAREPVPMLV